jgi:hypothetical protein
MTCGCDVQATVYEPVSNPFQTDYIANQHFLTLPHKVIWVWRAQGAS